MSYTTSPNMYLRIPAVGSEQGPDYALDINYDLLNILDTHDHSPGRGIAITPAAMDINANVNFNNHFAYGLGGLTLLPQSSTPTLNTLYESVNDLYYVDGVGNNIRITQSGGVAGTPGSITNLVAPASANYVAGSQTFVWQSNIGVAANMDAGSLTLRDLAPNSTFGVSINPPAALALNYDLTLPLLPAVQSFMTLDASGNMDAPWTVDGSTIAIISNQLVVQGPNIPNSSREHNWELNGEYPTLTYPLYGIDALFIVPYNIQIQSVWIYNANAGSGGTTEFDLQVGTTGGGAFTSILSTTGKITSAATSSVWTDSGSIIGAQAGVTKPVISVANISAGQAIKWDLIQSMTGPATDARIRIFYIQT